jgi:hypothetical protein
MAGLKILDKIYTGLWTREKDFADYIIASEPLAMLKYCQPEL